MMIYNKRTNSIKTRLEIVQVQNFVSLDINKIWDKNEKKKQQLVWTERRDCEMNIWENKFWNKDAWVRVKLPPIVS